MNLEEIMAIEQNAGTARGAPLSIKVNERDNVAIVVNEGGLPEGATFSDGLTLIEAVPQGHKVALEEIAQGEAIVRYGHVIGVASRPIARGSWVEESAVALPTAPDLDQLEAEPWTGEGPAALDASLAARLDVDLAALSGLTFDGYLSPDGSVGSKNLLAFVPSVQCVAGVLLQAAKRIEAELLPNYPHVDGVVVLNHGYGCGVAINAPNADVPIRTLRNLVSHPNFGGEAVVVGLGCEKLMPDRIAGGEACEGCAGQALGQAPADIFVLQEAEGYEAMIEGLLRLAETKLARLESRRRVARPLSDLVVGVQCGGSDAFSGVTANPAIGYACDLLVRAGGTALFSEVTEVRDAVYLMTPRAATPEVKSAIIREMRWYDAYLDRGGADRSANPTPGNKRGGLANIVEKAMGSIAKSGSSPIAGVLSPGERARGKGMIFAATPASDFVCGTEQLASGIAVQVFSTGRGTPYGLAAAPVIKVSSRSWLARHWPDLIDVDAGKIAEGEATIEEVGRELFVMMVDTASGRYSPWADIHGIKNDLVVFNPAPIT
jgi:galactarate dehydratase